MHYAIDRIEDEQVVLEADNGDMLVVERMKLPSDARQGDVLTVCDGLFCHDREETESRRTRIHRLEQMLRGGHTERK